MFYKCLYCRSYYGLLEDILDHILNKKCPNKKNYEYEYEGIPKLNYVIVDNSNTPKIYNNYLYS